MFDVKDRGVLNYVPDYKLNLIVPGEIEDFEKFKTELGPLFEFISCADSGDKLERALGEKGQHWEQLSEEAIDLLNACLRAKLKTDRNSRGGTGNVCKGIEELAAKREAQGEARGVLITYFVWFTMGCWTFRLRQNGQV